MGRNDVIFLEGYHVSPVVRPSRSDRTLTVCKGYTKFSFLLYYHRTFSCVIPPFYVQLSFLQSAPLPLVMPRLSPPVITRKEQVFYAYLKVLHRHYHRYHNLCHLVSFFLLFFLYLLYWDQLVLLNSCLTTIVCYLRATAARDTQYDMAAILFVSTRVLNSMVPCYCPYVQVQVSQVLYNHVA